MASKITAGNYTFKAFYTLKLSPKCKSISEMSVDVLEKTFS